MDNFLYAFLYEEEMMMDKKEQKLQKEKDDLECRHGVIVIDLFGDDGEEIPD